MAVDTFLKRRKSPVFHQIEILKPVLTQFPDKLEGIEE